MIEIVVENDVFTTSNTDIVDTKIYIKYDEYYFPSQTWSDFTFPVLEEWKENLIKIRNSEDVITKLYFHDGAFWLEVYKDKYMQLKIEGKSGGDKNKSDITLYCGYYEFINSLRNAMKSFLKVLDINNMHEGDFASIYQQTLLSIKELKQVLLHE